MSVPGIQVRIYDAGKVAEHATEFPHRSETFDGGSGGSANNGVSRVVATGTTRTIADTFSLVVASYFSIEGTGILSLVGDASLEVL